MLLLDLGFADRVARDSANHDRARLTPWRPTEPAAPERKPVVEKLAGEVVSAVIEALETVNARHATVLRAGLTLSGARPGVKKMGFSLTDRLDPRRRLECSLRTAVRGDALVLESDCLGRAAEVARANIDDAKAVATLRAAAETYLLDVAAHFAQGACGPRAAATVPVISR
jgi:hypothetical protein